MPSLKRWFDMAIMTTIAVLIWIILYPFFYHTVNTIMLIVDPWPSWIGFPLTSFCLSAVWYVIIKLGGFQLRGLLPLTFFRYPPVWFFGIFGTILYLYFISHFYAEQFHSLNFKELFELIISILTGIILATWYSKLSFKNLDINFKSTDEDYIDNNDIESLLNDHKKLIHWVDSEKPIKKPSQDYFGLSLIAKRITRILINQKIKTIGIIGPYGSGKSSLINIVKFYLNSNPHRWNEIKKSKNNLNNSFMGKIVYCRVDGWGRSKDSIAQQVLSIVVRRLSLEIDCMSIINAPSNYQKAITGFTHPLARMIAVLLNFEEDPVNVLKKIDNILRTTNIRLIIFLEDLDRNTLDDVLNNEMPALLDRLRHLNNISFILAIGTELHYSSTLIRICDHLENIS